MMNKVEIKDGKVIMPEVHANAYWDTWPVTFSQVNAEFLLLKS